MGFFISFEGGEGAGKTTILKMVEKYLVHKGFNVITTREPGGIDIAEQIRNIILDHKNKAMDGRTEALLYAAARRQHLVEKVIPALKENKIVLCDRFIDSSLAYQGFAREIGLEDILSINQFAIEQTMPDLTIYLDVTPEVGLKRIKANDQREINRLDLESLSFHQKVREGYHYIAQKFPERIQKVNAEKPLEEVFAYIQTLLDEKL